jgi:NAD(P)-dependent dehydrogenase (short-subunit alcohol dehydrogenase family)
MTSSSSERLGGKTALVTGSTRGLGRTIVERLASEGARVIVNGRSAGDVESVVTELRSNGYAALGFEADLSSPSGAHVLAEAVLRSVDRLDILVNNAGMSYQEPFWETSDEDFEYQTNVNYRSPFILSQHAARHMIERGIRGRIVNFSTIGAHSCHADRLVYDAAKGAVEVMTRNMAFELGPHGISVNAVIPGAIAVRPGANGDTDAWRRYAQNNIPLGRVGHASDIATTVLFFCLPETEFISGQGLLVDGAHNTWLPESTE